MNIGSTHLSDANLGEPNLKLNELRQPEGTVEMFTGSYAPEYSFDFALPTPTEEDMRAMVQLARMEKELGAG